MPCNSDYLNPNETEIHLSRVLCLLDELEGKQWREADWRGFHPGAYGKRILKSDLDHFVAGLCQRLQIIDVTKYSLEMQIWWRDHQKADAERIKREQEWKERQAVREQAKAKLTPEEIEVLGLK